MAIYPNTDTPELRFAISFRSNGICYARLRPQDTAKFISLLKRRSGLPWDQLAQSLAYADLEGTNLQKRAKGAHGLKSGTVIGMAKLAHSHGWLSSQETEAILSLMRSADSMAKASRQTDLAVTKLAVDISKFHRSIGLKVAGDDCVALAESTYRSILFAQADELAKEDADYNYSAETPEKNCPRSSYRGLSSDLH